MKLAFARVVENERLYGNTYVTWFEAASILQGAAPGQFVMFRCVEPAASGEAPPTIEALPDAQFIRNVVDILFRTSEPKADSA